MKPNQGSTYIPATLKVCNWVMVLSVVLIVPLAVMLEGDHLTIALMTTAATSTVALITTVKIDNKQNNAQHTRSD